MTSRVVVMVEVTAVVWAMGVLVTDTSPKYSCLLRYSTCGNNADDTIARQAYTLELWTWLATSSFEMSDTTHAIKAYRSHDMQHNHEKVIACITQLSTRACIRADCCHQNNACNCKQQTEML